MPHPEQQITVTAAARGFSDLINRVRYRGESAVLVKGGVPVARLLPFTEPPRKATAESLARLLLVVHPPEDDRNRFAGLLALFRRTSTIAAED